MRKLSILTLAVVAAFSLAACNSGSQQNTTAPTAQAQAAPVLPTDPIDDRAWKLYLTGVVKQNMEGIRSSPFMYYLPSAKAADFEDQYARQLDNVAGSVAAGVLPGNMLAFGSPEFGRMADLIIDAFKDASPGSFKGVKVLYIGMSIDAERARPGVEAAGGTFVFIEAK